MRVLYFVLFSFLSLAFIFQPQKMADGTCASLPEDWYESYQFFAPISFAEMSDFDFRVDSTENDNLKEWKKYFKDRVGEKDIYQIVYKASADDMQKIRAAILNPAANLKAELKENALVKYLQDKKEIKSQEAVEIADYLFYAKTCEPEALKDGQWDEDKRDITKMKWLADAGKKYYKEKASSDFLKLRFAYQAIRMAHYTHQYDKVLRFFEEMVEPLKISTESIIYYWTLALKAGALKKSGQEADAAYLFSIVFDKCISRRPSSFLSFEIKNEQNWQKSLKLCQNNEEKTTLYFMRSLQPESDGLAEMENIYQILPTSEKLALMLAREINKLETDLLNINLNENLLFFKSYQGFPKADAIQYLGKLKRFVGQVNQDKKVKQPEIWFLAENYLDYLAGNPQKALAGLNELAKNSKDKSFKNQIEIFKLAIQISGLTQVNEELENQLYEAVNDTKHKHLYDFMVNAFARLYDKQNELGKAFLCRNDIWALKSDPKMPLIENLLILAEKKRPSKFEKEFLLKKITFDYYNNVSSKFSATDVLLEIKATLLFAQDKLEDAIVIYKQLPNEVMYKIEGDPFQANLLDCQDCPNSTGKGKYTRLTLAQKMLQLKKTAEKNTIDQEKIYFQLGTAYYNLTHFGNSWMAVDYYRSGSDYWSSFSKEDNANHEKIPINLDYGKASYYFDRAMNAAIKSANQELAAQSCFMAAKCEQHIYYLKVENFDGWSFIPPNYAPENRRYFTRLAQDFKKTQYYKEAIRECKYFNDFVRR
jgi:hypothetical protein